MKKILIGAIASLLGGVLLALAGPDMVAPFTFSSSIITTNDTANTAGSSVTGAYVNAWVDAIVFDWTDSGGEFAQTATVSVVTQGDTGSGPSRTILTLTDVACTDDVKFPRGVASGTTGTALTTPKGERIPLVQDKVVVSAYNKLNTNYVALTVRVILSPTP